MARISQREKILLGYGSSNSNSMSNSSSRRNSEVDFSDVFGGPPRCSTQEYYQYEDDDSINCIDDDNANDNDNDNDGESGDGLRVSWFGLTEKPVFGEQVGGRRRYTSEDFYGDIFGGDQPLLSCSLSPSVPMLGRNPFSSAPGSRNMSPSRQLSPAAEPCAAPSMFSLPGRVANTDVLTSTSVNQSSKLSGRSLSRFNQTMQSHSVFHGDTPSPNQPNTLSRQVSIDGKESISDLKLDKAESADYEEELIMNSKDSKFCNENIQFHFSIYKWPSKGVPFVMSSRERSTSRSKERKINTEIYLSTSEGISKLRVPSTSQVKNEDIILHVTSAECNSENDTGQVVFDVNNKVKKAPYGGVEGTKKMSDHSVKSSEAVADDISLKQSLKKTKSNMKSLGSLFGEEKKGKKNAAPEKGGKKNKVNETKKPYMIDSHSSYNLNKGKVYSLTTGEKETDEISSYDVNKSKVHKSSTRAKANNDISSNNINKSKVHMSSTGAKDDICKGDGSGKVKDFVKIFNLDNSSSTTKSNVGKSRSWRWKNTTNFEAEKEVDSLLAKKHDEMQASYVNFEKTWSESIEVIDGASFLSEEQVFNIDEPIIDDTEASTTKNYTSVDDILDKGMVQDIDTQLATESQEEIKSYEHKVRQWSKGKEGNIRALLSTMQYVLWPNSGWKPIPLVDIIEANAVKKAYQRALLCLHPDKLQQKGAATYQKLIAEKVFDILQESWDQFNAVGLLS